MKIFVAGASGAIGNPLVSALIRQGHTVTGMTRSERGVSVLKALGATPVVVDALDASAVLRAMQEARPDAVVNELTALPKDPAQLAAAQTFDRKLRLTGTVNLQIAAQQCRVHRFIQQSSGFYLQTSEPLADETAKLAVDGAPGVAASSQMYAELEQRTLSSPVPGIVLRYGFFYGPGTWYDPDGGAAVHIRGGEQPVTEDAPGLWSFVHVEDAAEATAAALEAAPGIYNVVDDDPSPVGIWLPRFAHALGAPVPPRASLADARTAGGEDAVFYATKLCGANNAKAKRILGFKPRRLEWLT